MSGYPSAKQIHCLWNSLLRICHGGQLASRAAFRSGQAVLGCSPFITPDKLTQANILYRLDLLDRHYYRLRKQATNILSTRLRTAPVGCLDAWMEVLTLLDR